MEQISLFAANNGIKDDSYEGMTLKALQAGRQISQMDCYHDESLGFNTRLAATICTLRQKGFIIFDRWEKSDKRRKKYKRYFMAHANVKVGKNAG